mmetsp:Transcript_35943/g.91870  ORF Transcript_35943/g.91870 Transcript_35943/m.91870 type:complete len:432 (-) Transcript_35943:27-1322(-)
MQHLRLAERPQCDCDSKDVPLLLRVHRGRGLGRARADHDPIERPALPPQPTHPDGGRRDHHHRHKEQRGPRARRVYKRLLIHHERHGPREKLARKPGCRDWGQRVDLGPVVDRGDPWLHRDGASGAVLLVDRLHDWHPKRPHLLHPLRRIVRGGASLWRPLRRHAAHGGGHQELAHDIQRHRLPHLRGPRARQPLRRLPRQEGGLPLGGRQREPRKHHAALRRLRRLQEHPPGREGQGARRGCQHRGPDRFQGGDRILQRHRRQVWQVQHHGLGARGNGGDAGNRRRRRSLPRGAQRARGHCQGEAHCCPGIPGVGQGRLGHSLDQPHPHDQPERGHHQHHCRYHYALRQLRPAKRHVRERQGAPLRQAEQEPRRRMVPLLPHGRGLVPRLLPHLRKLQGVAAPQGHQRARGRGALDRRQEEEEEGGGRDV